MIIWALVGALTLVAMLPLAITVLRPARARGRTEADLALYHAQLAELDRERDAGRLDAATHAAATLEVQRRILSGPKEDAVQTGKRSAAFVAAALFIIPAAAIGLYLTRGIPEMPSAPYDLRRQQAEAEERLLDTLRERIAQVDPSSEAARQGASRGASASSACQTLRAFAGRPARASASPVRKRSRGSAGAAASARVSSATAAA